VPNVAADEFRGMWVDAFHAGLRNSTETTAVINAARTARCNAVIVQVRKRGDAYYRNGIEPVATDVAAGFDPLADLIQRAHSGTPRIEVHAWIVTYNIWGNQTTPPSQSTHPYYRFPDYLTQNGAGTRWDGGNYALDPGHPGAQQHIHDVAMDIISRYDIDGLHLDYIRYSERSSTLNNQPWGYNPVAVERYKRSKEVTTTPASNDVDWLQWRREQVTGLVRKIYLNAWAQKPNVRISAALIPWGSAPSTNTLTAWRSTSAYAVVLQDWRGWMEEGIVDLGCPMVYRADNSGFIGWSDYAKNHQFSRQTAIGGGWYQNSIANNIAQIKATRAVTSLGRAAAGLVGYSYAVPNKDSVSQATTWLAYTNDAAAETYDPGGDPVFAQLQAVPPMPWKSDLTRGNLAGTALQSGTNIALDGATVQITGPASRTLKTDGTGFFGVVGLPPGTYTVSIQNPGFEPKIQQVTVEGAEVSQVPMVLARKPFVITQSTRTAAQLTITWNAVPGRRYQVQSSTNLSQWSLASTVLQATAETMTFSWTIPTGSNSGAFLRVVEQL
jgi:uncharacterized lipoprotein YddW (UPF0748 family)